MKNKSIFVLLFGSLLLLGCANSGHYPITGQAVGIDDQVKFMSAPDVVLY